MEESKGLKRAVGESQGTLDRSMDVDEIIPEDWESTKQDLRENKTPLLRITGVNQARGIHSCKIQDMLGEFYIWETPKNRQTHQSVRNMNHIGGHGILVGDAVKKSRVD